MQQNPLTRYMRQHPFLVFTAKRVLMMALTVFTVASLSFLLMKFAPGSPFQDEKGLPLECLAQLEKFYGLDKPLSEQYLKFLKSLFTFDFGPSLKYPNQTVNDIIRQSFPVSLLLAIEALFIALVVGVSCGIYSALYQKKKRDTFITFFSSIGISLPSFVVAALLQFAFAISIPLFPIARWGSLSHTILPALTLALAPSAMIARLLRASMIETLKSPYVFHAKTRGLTTGHIILFHVLKNASLPVLSYLGPLVANILVGSFVVEKIFAAPGLGQWFVVATLSRDYAIIGGLTLFYSLIFQLVSFVVDLIHLKIDPKMNIELQIDPEIDFQIDQESKQRYQRVTTS